jgi:hypothetical protein
MLNSDGQVAGVQMDFNWDADCLTANVRSSGGPQCRSNAATGKTVQSAMRGGSGLRAIMLSVADVNPIPDGELFCCEFTVDSFASAPQCPIRLSNVIGANPTGQRVAVSTREGVVYVLGGGEASAAPPAAGIAPAAPGGATTAGDAGGAVTGGAPAAGLPADAPAAGAAPVAGLAPAVEAPAPPPPAAPAAGTIEPPAAGEAPAELPGELPAPGAALEVAGEAIDVPQPRGTEPAAPADAPPADTATPSPQPEPATPTVAPTRTPRAATPTTAPTRTPTTASGFLGGCVMIR